MAQKNLIGDSLKLLGQEATDVVTGVTGMVSSVCFDAYGCVQAAITRKAKDDGSLAESYWFDVKRVILTGKAVLTCPDFGLLARGQEIGAAEKPSPRS